MCPAGSISLPKTLGHFYPHGRGRVFYDKVWAVKKRTDFDQFLWPLFDLTRPFWKRFWNPQGLSFLKTPKNHKLSKIWWSNSPKHDINQNFIWQCFGWSCSLCMAFFGHFWTIFEILRVLAFCLYKNLWNQLKFNEATAQNVKIVKESCSSFSNFYLLKCRSNFWWLLHFGV